jgi:PAS domain S-box-containing protein
MVWQVYPYVYLMLAAGAVSLMVAFLAHRRGRVAGWRALVAINCVGAVWALTAALELSSASLDQAVFFHKLSFLGMEAIGPAWFIFTVRFSGRDRWGTSLKMAVLSALPVTTLVLLVTNQYHGLVFKALTMEPSGSFLVLHKTPGPWWWLDTVYTYCLLAAGLMILGVMFFREIGLYRRQIAAIVAGLVVQWGADLIYVSTQGAASVNLTPALFSWVGLVLYWGFVRYQLLDVAPVAREFVAEHLSDALVVFDQVGRVTYLNLAAEELLGVRLQNAAGRPLEIVAASSPGLFALYAEARDSDDDALQDWENGGRHYDGRVSALRDKRGNPRGTVLVLRDTTDRKVAELALDEARRDLEIGRAHV